MMRALLTITLVAFAHAAAPGIYAMSEQAAITQDQVLAFLAQYEIAQSTEDFEQVAPMIHPDALFRFNDGDFRGTEAIKGAFEGTWANDVKDERYELKDIEVTSLDGSTATAVFAFHWSGIAAHGPFAVEGRGTVVIVRHEGALKIKVEHLGPQAP